MEMLIVIGVCIVLAILVVHYYKDDSPEINNASGANSGNDQAAEVIEPLPIAPAPVAAEVNQSVPTGMYQQIV